MEVLHELVFQGSRVPDFVDEKTSNEGGWLGYEYREETRTEEADKHLSIAWDLVDGGNRTRSPRHGTRWIRGHPIIPLGDLPSPGSTDILGAVPRGEMRDLVRLMIAS